MNKNRLFAAFAAAVYVVAVSGCATLEGGAGGGGLFSNINLLSTGEEVTLGEQFAVEVEKQETLVEDAALQAYVTEIGARLAVAAPRQDVVYSFKVIDAPDTVNAFALPGGFMYIYTGLMKVCDDEAELAAVMAHEIAHVAARHHGEMMTRQLGMDLVSGLILGEQPGAAASIVSQLFAAGISARFSRAQEREADALGMDILYRAGYPPQAMISFMGKLLEADRQRGGGRALPIFATHPAPDERIQLLQQLMQRYPAQASQDRPALADRYRERALTRIQ